jgi:two-component system, OmpR family, heavy metal sensor histidine kinase CusS
VTARRPVSLSGRLSVGLALLSLTLLLLVCVAVYGWAGYGQARQQDRALEMQRLQIEHLFAEARESGDLEQLTHKLSDVTVAQRQLGVEVRRADGQIVFSHAGVSGPKNVRTMDFPLPPPSADGQVWRGRLTYDLDADDRSLQRLGISLAIAAVAGACLISTGGVFLIRRGLRPVSRLVDQIQSLTAASHQRRLDGSAQPAELVPLVDHFNELLGRLESAFTQLAGFNADVAHELGNPLSTLIAGTELALRRERRPEELQAVLGSNLEELQRLARIVQDMLFLARADHGNSARRSPMARIADLVDRVAAYHEAVLNDKELSLTIEGDAFAAVDAALVERALSNLLANATRHAHIGSAICVRVRPDSGKVTIQVENDGEVIPAGRLERIFDRFYRGDSARENADRHHGLGLSIVAAIARMHGGSTFARSSAGHTVVGFTLIDHGASDSLPIEGATSGERAWP